MSQLATGSYIGNRSSRPQQLAHDNTNKHKVIVPAGCEFGCNACPLRTHWLVWRWFANNGAWFALDLLSNQPNPVETDIVSQLRNVASEHKHALGLRVYVVIGVPPAPAVEPSPTRALPCLPSHLLSCSTRRQQQRSRRRLLSRRQ